MGKRNITVRLDVDLLKKIDLRSKEEGLTRTAYICNVLEVLKQNKQ